MHVGLVQEIPWFAKLASNCYLVVEVNVRQKAVFQTSMCVDVFFFLQEF